MATKDLSFRTLLRPEKSAAKIDRDEDIVLIGSCFADNIGSRLVRDGFHAYVNPMGALYNPLSMATSVRRALNGESYTQADLIRRDDIYHCLDFESKRQGADCDALLSSLNLDFSGFGKILRGCKTWIVTFGTAWIFEHEGSEAVVGNCHKFPASDFRRRRSSVDEIVEAWQPLCSDRRIIFTVSPVRHLADGLHGNQLSKATLLLAVERLCKESGGEYFPAYEAVMDDLRDYRFYASDMKHVSDFAADYIYGLFSETYFTSDTIRMAEESRKEALRAAHRNIL